MKRLLLPAIVFLAVGGSSCFGCSEGSDGKSDAGTTKRDGGSGSGACPAGGAYTRPVASDGPALLGGLDCDPLVPTQCGLPFPSNVYLVDNAATVTKKSVKFGKTTLPIWARCDFMDRTAWEDSDGWSASQGPITHLPGATLAGLATQDTIEKSVEKDAGGAPTHPTILLNAATGELVPHFSELDMGTDDENDRVLIIRPVVRLEDATRYIVAIRKIVNTAGTALEPSPVFKALRDGSASTDPSVEPRKALYADIFAKLEAAKVGKTDLQIAWDYTTASRDNNTKWLISMRDQALATVGTQGPAYTIISHEDDPNEHIKRRINGRMTVPLFLTDTTVTGRMVFDENHMPKQNGTAEFEFEVQIPKSVAADTAPAAILQQGHGLMGSRHEGRNGYFAKLAQKHKYVTITVDLIGLSEPDEDEVLEWVTGDMSKFRTSVDRQHQGLVNSVIAMQLMRGRFVTEPLVQFGGHSVIDPTKSYYRGDSQGGIMGLTYTAISPHVIRAYLGEPGMSYNYILNRSVDFDDFFVVLQGTYANAKELAVAMGLIQMHWDRTEPAGYAPYVTKNPLPNTPTKEVLLHAAKGDYQVTPLGAHVMARAVGAKLVRPALRPVYGIPLDDSVNGVFTGSGLQEFDFGVAEVPKTNTPPRPKTAAGDPTAWPENQDPHDKVRELDHVLDATDYFLRTGEIKNFCAETCDPN